MQWKKNFQDLDHKMRPSGRELSQLREISIEPNISMHAAGSCLVKFGNTHVICTASVDEFLPHFLKNKGKGWVTAEYGMLPGSTNTRSRREVKQPGGQTGRTHEIQRLIGRSLRSTVDMVMLGERQIVVDCDVIQADGGTRTASITGGYVALYLAINKLVRQNIIKKNAMCGQVAAISCGIYKGHTVIDLDYEEDSAAEVDANFVMATGGKIIEVQGTAEGEPFTREQFNSMMDLADAAIKKLFEIQNQVIGKDQ